MRVRPRPAAVAALALGCAPEPVRPVEAERWTLSAVEVARSVAVPVSRLVDAPDDGATVDMTWLFYVATGFDRVVLVDAGHDFAGDDARADSWHVATSVAPEEALGRLGLRPEDVTDVVLTHHHWDHVTGVTSFDAADVHALAAEWAVAREQPGLARIEDEGRLFALDETPTEVLDGVVLEERGHHTAHSAVVEVDCGVPALVLMDAAYLYRNVEDGLPIASTPDPERNVAEVRALVDRAAAAGGVVLPGHDPEVFERFPSPSPGVATICR